MEHNRKTVTREQVLTSFLHNNNNIILFISSPISLVYKSNYYLYINILISYKQKN